MMAIRHRDTHNLPALIAILKPVPYQPQNLRTRSQPSQIKYYLDRRRWGGCRVTRKRSSAFGLLAAAFLKGWERGEKARERFTAYKPYHNNQYVLSVSLSGSLGVRKEPEPSGTIGWAGRCFVERAEHRRDPMWPTMAHRRRSGPSAIPLIPGRRRVLEASRLNTTTTPQPISQLN